MLRPATPLSILLLISFVLLLISVISTPVVKGIPLATFEGVNFGVFGYCKGDVCSGIRVGYTTDGLFGSADSDGDFNLPASTRHSLSSLLIVHPIAAFFNLVCLGLAIASHFHSPSHSSRYLLGLLILLLPTLLVTLLAFLVDILLFVPHLQWAGWIVLVSTILVTISGIVTCAMRRTLVSRKARKRRIQENAEMSGENFYNRQAGEAKLPLPPPLTAAETKAPMVNGAPGADNLPSFSTYAAARRSEEGRPMPPMAPVPTPAMPSRSNTYDQQMQAPNARSQSQPPRSNSRDQYGNPISPVNGYVGSSARNRSEERRTPGPYGDDMYGAGRGGYGPSRGRGGYPSRGSYGPRGGYGAPGGRAPPPQQAYGGRGGYPNRSFSADRSRGGYAGPAAMAGAIGGGMAAGAMMNRGQRQPPPGYPPPGQAISTQYPTAEQYSPVSRPTSDQYDQRDDVRYQPTSPQDYTRGQPDAYGAYGARSQSPGREGRQSPHGSRGQSPAGGYRQPSPPPPVPTIPILPPEAPAAELSGSGRNLDGAGGPYAQDEYVPPRQGWASAHNAATVPSPTSHNINTSPVELATAHSTVAGPNPNISNQRRVNSGDSYYEDVNPRFAAESDPLPPPQPQIQQSTMLHPHDQQARNQFGPSVHESLRPISDNLDATSSYEDLQQGARSPAESETSNFTSVSQRGVNPNWQPGDGPGAFGAYGPGPGVNTYGGIGRKPVGGRAHVREQQMRRDQLLTGNPDFEVPGAGAARRRGGGAVGGMNSRGGGAPMGRGPMMMGGMSTVSGGEGRYPAP